MKLSPDTLQPHYLDLRKSLPSLQSSLAPDYQPAAEEFSWAAMWMMMLFCISFFGALACACFLSV